MDFRCSVMSLFHCAVTFLRKSLEMYSAKLLARINVLVSDLQSGLKLGLTYCKPMMILPKERSMLHMVFKLTFHFDFLIRIT